MAWGLLAKAYVLDELGRTPHELAAYDEVLGRWGASREAALAEPVARAGLWRGHALGSLDRVDEALEAYESVAERAALAERDDVRVYAATALESLALLLGRLERHREAADAYERSSRAYDAIGDETSAARVLRLPRRHHRQGRRRRASWRSTTRS